MLILKNTNITLLVRPIIERNLNNYELSLYFYNQCWLGPVPSLPQIITLPFGLLQSFEKSIEYLKLNNCLNFPSNFFSRNVVISLILSTWILSFIIAFVPIFTNIYTTEEYLARSTPCKCDFVVNEWWVSQYPRITSSDLTILIHENLALIIRETQRGFQVCYCQSVLIDHNDVTLGTAL